MFCFLDSLVDTFFNNTSFHLLNQIINLLSQIQESCSNDEAKLIDRVLEFLKREGLYSPQMKEIRPDDPIATDLIGALLTVSYSRIERTFHMIQNV